MMTFIKLHCNVTSISKQLLPFKKAKHSMKLLLSLMMLCLTSACQTTTSTSTTPVVNNVISYSQYYLWLKTISTEEILAEEQKQQTLMGKIGSEKQQSNTDSLSKLILIYSLPTTTLHQPYRAKRLLNEYLLSSNSNSKENVAFSMLLRDQLNAQLKLLAKQTATDKAYHEELSQNKTLIEQLQQQIDQVNNQLILLKKIDQNINERG